MILLKLIKILLELYFNLIKIILKLLIVIILYKLLVISILKKILFVKILLLKIDLMRKLLLGR
jgi:hypothetical protein